MTYEGVPGLVETVEEHGETTLVVVSETFARQTRGVDAMPGTALTVGDTAVTVAGVMVRRLGSRTPGA